MPGFNITCIPKMVIDFSSVALGLTEQLILRQAVPTVNWREVSMLFRIYAHTLGGTSNSVTLGAFAQSISEQDPGLIFLDPTGTTSTCIVNNLTPAPIMLMAPAIPSDPPMIQVYALATRLSAGPFSVTFSLDICVKDV